MYTLHMTLRLREYQEQAVSAMLSADVLRPATVLPTAGGKTIIFGAMCGQLLAAGRRPLILVHRNELAEQAQVKVSTMVPGASVGIVKAEQNEVGADIVVGSVQTLRSEYRRDQLDGIGSVIVDECHHATAPTYIDLLTHFGCFEETPAYGFTATMSRSTGNKNLGDVWERIVYTKDIRWMISQGFLVEPVGYSVEVPDLDLDAVRRSGGDYTDGSLGEALQTSAAGRKIVEAWQERAADRKTVAFAPTVATAEMLAECFRDAGVTAEVLTGTTPTEERKEIFRRLRNGTTQVLCNCMVLTEGWDEPSADCAVIMRLTQSQSLYIQMVGRILRLFPGKADALVLDIVGNASRHGLRSIACLTRSDDKRLKDGEPLLAGTDRLDEEDGFVDPLVTPEVGPLKLRKVDLFDDSAWTFEQTAGGTWFGTSPKRYYFLWEVGDGYVVRGTQDQFKLGRPRLYTEHGPVPLDLALSIAEAEIENDNATSGFGTGKNAAWKRRRPTQKQIDYATRLRCLKMEQHVPFRDENGYVYDTDGNPLKNAGQLSRVMDRQKVSQWLAPYEARRNNK